MAVAKDPGARKTRKFCKYQDSFARIVADEAHNLRSMYAETHGIVLSMSYDSVWFLTATPYLNKISDFGGYLHLLWDPDWKQELKPGPDDTEDTDEPDEETQKVADPKLKLLDPDAIRREFEDIEIDETSPSLHLLCPEWFYALIYKGDIPIRDAWKIVPVLAKMIFLKRTCNSLATSPYHFSMIH